jgi:RHS repeat-associated protein
MIAPGLASLLSGWLAVVPTTGARNDANNKMCKDCGGEVPSSPAPTGGNDGLEAPNAACRSLTGRDLTRRPRTRNVGDVYLHSGEYFLTAEDLRIKGRGFDFVWGRKYRSREGRLTAMGWNWDFSYNIRVEISADDPNDLWVFDGETRRDTYRPQPNGCWAAAGLFNDLCLGGGFTYVLTMPNGTRWSLKGFDGSANQGRILAITDRNNNTMTFDYDGAGRLMTVTDTLGRPIQIAYTVDGYIGTVTDFLGRQVKYAYYQAADAGGGAGDLKSRTTPIVTGTTNLNDFPNGKTVTYMYSKGQAHPALNHNLVIIKDALGQEVVQNKYFPTANPALRAFDRLLRQTFPTGTIDYFYVAETPLAGNGMATTRTIIRDQNRNVREALFDQRNHMVRLREYTGRAPDGNQPTTDTVNRPVAKLRSTDPDYFETQGVCNADSLRTTIVSACGDSVYMLYEEDLGGYPYYRRILGNLRQTARFPGPRGGDQGQIVETFEHLFGFGSCCGESFVTRHTDPRGHLTVHSYDFFGNRTGTQERLPEILEDFEYNALGQVSAYTHPDNGSGWRRRDVFNYYASGPWTGYLQERRIDVNNKDYVTTYQYDVDANLQSGGRLTRVITPLGQDSLFEVNALDQTVRAQSRETSPGNNVRYRRDTSFDAENQVIRTDVQNRDDSGAIQANADFSTRHFYDAVGREVRTEREVDPTRIVAETTTYDGNGNVIATASGESVAGRQPANTARVLWDERDLEYREIGAPGDPSQSSLQLDYDCAGNLSRVSDGLEGVVETSSISYDGYNRPVAATDPTGNVETYQYDPNDNVTQLQTFGEVNDGPGSLNNVRLSEVTHQYDDADRPLRDDSAFFSPSSQAPIGDGFSSLVYTYSPAGGVLTVTDDNGHVTQTEYDTTLEVSRTVDPRGDSVQNTYDSNLNLIGTVETEKTDIGEPDQQFITTYSYDGLDRLIRTADPSGNITDRAYDSRHNLVQLLDGRRAGPLAPGNRTRFAYDGLNRMLSATRTLTDTGTGGGVPIGTIVTTQAWDDSSRMLQECDGNARCTSYQYDPQDRITRTSNPDGTFATREYDVHDNVVREVDENGTVIVSTYDAQDGVTRRDVTPGPGVSGATTFETYTYDGESRLVRAENNLTVVLRTYDSLGNLVSEAMNGLVVQNTADGEGNELGVTYPSGRHVTTSFDTLDRIASLSDQGGAIASFAYAGPDRLRRRTFGNGTQTLVQYDGVSGVPNPVNDFGVKRAVRMTASNTSNGAILDDRTFTWDQEASRTRRVDLLVTLPGQQRSVDFEYDSVSRLRRATGKDSAAVVTRQNAYTLDAAGNRTSVTGPGGGVYTESVALPEPADSQMNQYSSTPFDTRLYDRNGNLASVQATGSPTPRTLSFDYRNRLVRVSDSSSGLDAQYVYDVFGRRLERRTGSTPVVTARFAYHDAQEVEETDPAGATRATFVYGNGVDEMLEMRRSGQDYYFHADDQGNVFALSGSAGTVVERYEYDDFGKPSAPSAVGNPYLHDGRRYDSDTGLYFYRTRYYDPSAGRFIGRDALGAWGDPEGMGNAFSYQANNPWSRLDPTGMAVDSSCGSYTPMLLNRLDEASSLARGAYHYLARQPPLKKVCDPRYLFWFGLYTHSRYNIVEGRFASISDKLQSGNFIVDCTPRDECQYKHFGVLSVNAFVGGDVQQGGCPDNSVCLCQRYLHAGVNDFVWTFEQLPTGNTERSAMQAGIMVHEFSHLFGTGDYAYGWWPCKGLAQMRPATAIHTADSYRLFAMQDVPGGCAGLFSYLPWEYLATRDSLKQGVRFVERSAKKLEKGGKSAIRKAEDAAKSVARKIKNKFHH